MRVKEIPDSYYIEECFEVNNGKLIWKNRPLEHFDGNLFRWRLFNSRFSGKESGSICIDKRDGSHRCVVNLDYKSYYRHKIIFSISNGYCPNHVDHKDGNSLNDDPENLRPATIGQNNVNAKKRKDNSTGFKGVSHRKERKILKRYEANISVSGKQIYIGNFMTSIEAREAYIRASIKYHGEFTRE